MKCPEEVQEALLEILYETMLEVRHCGGDKEYCFALGDHAHNIPHLIGKFTEDTFKYYWECEIPCFREKLEALERKPPFQFEQHWKVLRDYYGRLNP